MVNGGYSVGRGHFSEEYHSDRTDVSRWLLVFCVAFDHVSVYHIQVISFNHTEIERERVEENSWDSN